MTLGDDLATTRAELAAGARLALTGRCPHGHGLVKVFAVMGGWAATWRPPAAGPLRSGDEVARLERVDPAAVFDSWCPACRRPWCIPARDLIGAARGGVRNVRLVAVSSPCTTSNDAA